MALQEQSIIRLVRTFAQLPQQTQKEGVHLTIERAGELLWDLTADPEAAALLCRYRLQAAIMLQLQACAANLRNQSSHRIVELSLGMLANLYGIHQLVPELTKNATEILDILDLFLVLDDAPSLSELCRMLVACLTSDEGASAWLPSISQHKHQFVPQLLMIVTNTLHAQLLERSLLLVAALLQHQSDELAIDLLQYGLADVVAELLQSGTQVTTQGMLTNEFDTVAAPSSGTWSDQDAALDEPTSSSSHVYRQPEVLLAVIAVLEKLGQQPDMAAALIRQQPQLPVLLLQVLSSTTAAGEQHVVEALLPVLVMFSSQIMPHMLQQLPQQGPKTRSDDAAAAAPPPPGDGSSCTETTTSICLQLLTCIAEALQDCSSDSLDAMDAGWYLVALTATEFVQQVKQQTTSSSRSNHLTSPLGGWPGQLPQLCSHLCRAIIPATSLGYGVQALRCVISSLCFMHNSLLMMTNRSDQAANRDTTFNNTEAGNDTIEQVCSKLESAVPYVQYLAQHVLQQCQQQQQGDMASPNHSAAAALLQDSLEALGQLFSDKVDATCN